MIRESQRESLQQKGYEVIGTHSAVKMCRWTKNALKGRGQCYKHAFYGIASHQCMEATPSMACANKCTFCWRSYANPVAMRWNFATDDPQRIVEESLEAHSRRFVRQVVSGGVARENRAREAEQVRHCALSLVGEPVLYPRIGELLADLHARRISTFVVTNGQFPAQLKELPRVTQLYVSVDAPGPEKLTEVGRPLFADAWQRLLTSLDALREHGLRGRRTVCRLTLCRKDMTPQAARGYAELLRRAQPDFVEAKGVTPVPQFNQGGNSIADMVPTHSEVRLFAELLQQELARASGAGSGGTVGAYGLACEHRHSCAVLLAREDKWRTDRRQWRTWIDFEAFFEMQGPASEEEGAELAWSAPTPAWALWDAPEAGLDPEDTPRPRLQSRPDSYVDLATRGPRAAVP